MSLHKKLLSDLERIVPYGIEIDVPLAEISRWKIGGKADVIIRPESPDQVKALRQYFYKRDIKHVVIGITSNLLFADEGLRTPCIQIGSRMGKVAIKDDMVTAQAGAWVPGLARKIQKAGLSGAEHICGIPGTVGGLICMNGGSQRKGIGSSVVEILSIDECGVDRVRSVNECNFSYRNSIFQKNNEIIVDTLLKFEKATKPALVRREMIEILTSRRNKFPQNYPNCGSVFKSDPKLYEKYGTPGAIVERLGYKGYRNGGALIPDLHANFILNFENASAADVISIIKSIKLKAKEQLDVSLESEVFYITQFGDTVIL